MDVLNMKKRYIMLNGHVKKFNAKNLARFYFFSKSIF